jgi:glucokinase
MHTALGLDIGGTRLKAVAIKSDGTLLHEVEVDSHANEGPEEVRATLRNTVEVFRQKGICPSTIGIGCAGSVDPRIGTVRNSPNFAHWKNVPLKAWAELDFGVPVSLDNDANCAVVAEWKQGKGVGRKNFLLLTLGTGIGGGVVIENRLFRGNTGTAAELGHISIFANGEACPCGNRGCFERYCSGTAIRRQAGDISSKEVFSNPTDERFIPVIENFLFNFSAALTSLANIFDPEAILLGGQVSLGVVPYLPRIRETVRKQAFPAIAAELQIEQAHFGNLSGSLGAALLALEEHPEYTN